MKLAVVVSMFFALLSVSVVHADEASLLNGRWKLVSITCGNGAPISETIRRNYTEGYAINLNNGNYEATNTFINGCSVHTLAKYSVQQDHFIVTNRTMTVLPGCGNKSGTTVQSYDYENNFVLTGQSLILQAKASKACPNDKIEIYTYIKQ